MRRNILERFRNEHGDKPLGSKERLALALMLYTGQRRSDVVKLGRQHLSGNGAVLRVALRQEKTDEPRMIPIHPVLVSVLSASQCNNLTFW